MKKIVWLLLCISMSHAGIAQEKPKLFLVGDSISMHYTPYLKADVAGRFSFSRKASPGMEVTAGTIDDPKANGQDSRLVLSYLRTRFAEADFHPDVVLINCGMWDIKRDPKTNQIVVAADEYKSNLVAIADLVRSKRAKMIWINTTPVDDARHNSISKSFYRFNADVVAYNDIAEKLFNARHVPIVDLYTFTEQLGPGHRIDHAHFDEPTRALQAAYIAGFLDSWQQN